MLFCLFPSPTSWVDSEKACCFSVYSDFHSKCSWSATTQQVRLARLFCQLLIDVVVVQSFTSHWDAPPRAHPGHQKFREANGAVLSRGIVEASVCDVICVFVQMYVIVHRCVEICVYIYIYQPTLTWPAQEKAIQVLDLFGEFFRFASLFRFPNGWVTPKSHEIKCLDPHPDLQVAAGWQHPLSWHSAKKTISWWWMGVEMDARMGYVWMEVDGAGVLEVVAVYSWSFWWTTSMNHFCSSFWGSLFASFQLWFNFPRVHLVSREKHTPYKLTTVIPYGLPENCIIPAIPNWIQDPRKSSFTQPSTLQVGRASRSVPIDPYGSSTSVGAEMGTAFSPKLMNYTVSVYPHIHISIYPYIHISLHT